jgi:glycosyltransferase involved in cell wall biosynthesis
MHFLHVIGSLNPADGGPPEVSRQFTRAYAAIGDTMEIVCQDAPDSPFLKDFPCPVHALGQRWLGRFGLSPRLWKWLHQNVERYDGVVVQGIWTFAGLATRHAVQSIGKPYCVFPHGTLDPWYNEEYPLKRLKKQIFWPLQYPVLRDATAVFFTSDPEVVLAKECFTPNVWKSARYQNGISDPLGDPAVEMSVFYNRLPQLRDRRYLLFLARIQRKKGCDMLIDAFARVADMAPDVDIVMAGHDQEGWQAGLQATAASLGIAHRVHWPGMLTGQLKWGALRAADAFILPSHTENFGIAVVEALAARRPVLITNKVNIWPQIHHDRVGLVEDDTTDGIEQLLRRWLEMSLAERDAMAARCHPCYLKHYSLKEGPSAIHRAFEEALNAAPIAVAS